MKAVILPKAIYVQCNIKQNLNVILHRPWEDNFQFQIKTERKEERNKKAKTISNNKRIAGGINSLDLKLYYRVRVIRTPWYSHKSSQVDLIIELKTKTKVCTN